MPIITLEFETEEQKDRFFGWFLDGGGEYSFYNTEVELLKNLKSFETTFNNNSIKFSVCEEE